MSRRVEWGEAARKSRRDAWVLLFLNVVLYGVILALFLKHY